jgi:hypothetical protein
MQREIKFFLCALCDFTLKTRLTGIKEYLSLLTAIRDIMGGSNLPY